MSFLPIDELVERAGLVRVPNNGDGNCFVHSFLHATGEMPLSRTSPDQERVITDFRKDLADRATEWIFIHENPFSSRAWATTLPRSMNDLNDPAALEAMEKVEDEQYGVYKNIFERADLLLHFNFKDDFGEYGTPGARALLRTVYNKLSRDVLPWGQWMPVNMWRVAAWWKNLPFHIMGAHKDSNTNEFYMNSVQVPGGINGTQPAIFNGGDLSADGSIPPGNGAAVHFIVFHRYNAHNLSHYGDWKEPANHFEYATRVNDLPPACIPTPITLQDEILGEIVLNVGPSVASPIATTTSESASAAAESESGSGSDSDLHTEESESEEENDHKLKAERYAKESLRKNQLRLGLGLG
jgi:hypothetical protein